MQRACELIPQDLNIRAFSVNTQGELAGHLSRASLCFRQKTAVCLAMGLVAEGWYNGTECFEMPWWGSLEVKFVIAVIPMHTQTHAHANDGDVWLGRCKKNKDRDRQRYFFDPQMQRSNYQWLDAMQPPTNYCNAQFRYFTLYSRANFKHPLTRISVETPMLDPRTPGIF